MAYSPNTQLSILERITTEATMPVLAPSVATAALERLATALGSRDFATVLVTGQERVPHLTVASRHSPLAEDIYADCFYRWSWAEPICGVEDPLTAAGKITNVLPSPQSPPMASRHHTTAQ
jgi:hypothetical protein